MRRCYHRKRYKVNIRGSVFGITTHLINRAIRVCKKQHKNRRCITVHTLSKKDRDIKYRVIYI